MAWYWWVTCAIYLVVGLVLAGSSLSMEIETVRIYEKNGFKTTEVNFQNCLFYMVVMTIAMPILFILVGIVMPVLEMVDAFRRRA